jgi:hypothetical protein
MVREPDAGGDREGTSVQTVKGVAFGIVRELTRLPDTRDHGYLVGFQPQIDNGFLESG